MSNMVVMDVMIYQTRFMIMVVDYRCFVFNMEKNDAIKLLNNSCLDNKGILWK